MTSVECEHPTDAVRWDTHWAVLRCTACGRKLEMEDSPTDDPQKFPATSAHLNDTGTTQP